MALIFSPRQLTLRAQFYQQFAQMLGAGVSVLQTLDMLHKNPPARSYREPTRRMIERIKSADTVTEAMRHLGHWTPAFDLALIQAGEHSGRLDVVLRLLAGYYEDRARLLRQMLGDMAYPMFVLHFAIFLFPFIKFFSGGTLTEYLLKTFGVLIPMYALVFAMIYAAQGRHGQSWRSFLELLLKPVPMLGKARHYLALSRLAAALDALINAGVTIIESWDLAAPASGSPAIERAVAAWKPQVLAGVTPAQAVRNCPLFPEMFANFYASGEISGQLDESLRHLRDYYLEEGRSRMRFLAQWVPRFLYFGIAGYVAYKVITFYLGYFNQLNDIMK